MYVQLDFLQIIHYAACSTSVVATILLVFLILKHSSPEISTYKWYILWLSVTEAIAAFIFLLADIQVLFFGNWVIGGLVNGPFVFKECGYHYWAAFMSVISINWCFLPLCFLYRYLALCRPHLLHWLTRACSICVFFLWTSVTSVLVYLIIYYSGMHESVFTDPSLQATNHFATNIVEPEIDFQNNAALFAYTNYHNVLLNTAMLQTGIGLVIIYALIIRWALLIYRNLRENRRAMLENDYETHSKLSFALGLQTVLPLIFVVLPVLVFGIPLYMGYASFFLIRVIRAIFSIGMAINPLVSIAFIQQYRHAVHRYFVDLMPGNNDSRGNVIGVMDITTSFSRPQTRGAMRSTQENMAAMAEIDDRPGSRHVKQHVMSL